MRQKSLAYYFLNGALNVKPATRYMEMLNACSNHGNSSESWNQGFITQLQLHGLHLSRTMPEADERLYPRGLPHQAPPPHPDDGVTWPSDTYIVWDVS